MELSRRAYTLPGLALVALAVTIAACADRDPIGPQPVLPPVTERPLAALECVASVVEQRVTCRAPAPALGGARADIIVGGQNLYVTMAASNVSSGGGIFSFDATLTNLIPQPMGTEDGVTPAPQGIRVFFHNGPTATAGTGDVSVANPDGYATFTAANQPFFRYSEILEQNETSSPRNWQIAYDPGVESFAFTLYVSAPVQYEDGWIVVAPDTSVIVPGDSVQLAGTIYDFVGRLYGDAISWTSDPDSIATVDSDGLVAGERAGTATVTATATITLPGRGPVVVSGTATIIVNTPLLARDTTYDAIGNVTVSLDETRGLLNVVQDPDGDPVSIVAGTVTTAGGGTVAFAADGSFSYLTAPGFVGRDSVQYTATDGVHVASAWLKLVSARRFWYVRADAEAGAGTGAGTDAAPFASIGGAAAVWAANDTVLVERGDGSTIQAGVTLADGVALLGSGIGADLTTQLNGETVVLLTSGSAPAVGRSTAGAALTLAQGNTLRGLALGSSAGPAILGSSFGTLTAGELYVTATGAALDLTGGTVAGSFSQLSSTGSAGRGLSLTNVAGTIAPAGGGISGAAAGAIRVSGGTVVLAFAGPVSQSADAPLLHVSGGHTGQVTLSGALTATGGAGLVFDDAHGTYGASGEASLAGSAGVAITGPSTGTFAFGADVAISNPSGIGLRVDGGAPTLTFAGPIAAATSAAVVVDAITGGTITVSGNLSVTGAGRGVAVQNSTGGTVEFTAASKSIATTGSNTAVHIHNNDGVVTRFAGGGLVISTETASGFRATDGGTVIVTGPGNTVASAGGTAVNVQGTTIGTGGLVFASATANGAVEGIILSGTGGAHGLVVTGDGATAGSGGTVSNGAGYGILLSSTGNNDLRYMNVVGASGGISGSAFGGLAVNAVSVSTTGAPALNLSNGAVTGTFSNVTGSGASSPQLDLNAVGGTWTVAAGTVTGNATAVPLRVRGNQAGGTLNWAAALVQAEAQPVLFVGSGHSNGTLNVTGAISSTGNSTGLRFDDADGTYSVSPASATTLTGTGGGIGIVNGSSGSFTFSGNVHASSSAGAAVPFLVNGASPTVTFHGNLSKSGSATGALVSVTDQGVGSTLTFQNGTLSATAGDGILLSNADGAVSFTGMTTLSGGNARVRVINGSSGEFTFGVGTTVSNPTDELFAIHNSAPTFTYAGAFSKNNNAAIGINAQNNTGGSITFSGATKTLSTGAANAINLVGNGATSFLFSGGNLNITTNGGRGIRGVNGGTLRVSGSDNTIASTSGAAIDLDGVAVGTGGLTFRRIDASGDSVGIRIRDGGSTAGLLVTGTGSAGTGGTIQNTHSGASFTNAVNISLNWMNFSSANTVEGGADSGGTSGSPCDGLTGTGCRGAVVLNGVTGVTLNRLQMTGTIAEQGIVGNTVTNATVTNNTITNAGNAIWEHGIRFFDLLGRQNAITGNSVSGSGNFNLFIQNRAATDYSGVPDSVLISGNTFSNPGHSNSIAATKSSNVVVLSRTNGGVSGNLKAVITGNTLTNAHAAREAVDGVFGDASTNGKLRVVVTSNTVTGHNIPINVASAGNGSVLFDISNNPTVTAINGNGINVASNGSGFISGRINNNSVSTSAANTSDGIDIVVDQTGHAIVEVTNNTVTGSWLAGVRVAARNAGTGQADVTLSGNNATANGAFPFAGLWAYSGNNNGQSNRVCLNLATPLNNFVNTAPAAWEVDIALEQYAGSTFQLQGLTGSGTDYSNVQNWVSSRDAGGARVEPFYGTTLNYTNATCQTRTLP